MALIKCPECKKEISTKADKCPHCGAPAAKKTSGCAMLVAIMFGLALVGSMMSQCNGTSAPPAATAQPPPRQAPSNYAELKRKFDAGIADRYKELIAAKEAGNQGEVSRLLNHFKNFKRLDYENVAAIAGEVQTADLLERLKKSSATDIKGRAETYTELAKLNPANAEYADQAKKYDLAWKQAEAVRVEAERQVAAERQRIAARKQKIESQFSAWDGSHHGLERIIKKSMNDPDSYKHVETRYGEVDGGILVKTTFRGKNAFGGVVTNWIQAKFTLDGELIAVVAQGP